MLGIYIVEIVLEQMEAIRIVLCDDQNSSLLIPSWQIVTFYTLLLLP